MALFETVLVSDLKKPVQVKELTGNLFSADNNGNKITVSVMDNGTAAQISGNVTGYVIRADGKTVVVEGELVGNMASIVLPASAYTVVGRVSIVVKVGTTTVGACTSNVYRSTTDEVVDPGTVIPSITALMEQIAAAVEEMEEVRESIPADYTALSEHVDDLEEEKAPIANPEFTGSISLGRKTGTNVGEKSVAIGNNVEAISKNDFATGVGTKATAYNERVFGAYNVMSVIPWTPNTYYEKDFPVTYNGSIYTCFTPHTSGDSFNSSYWSENSEYKSALEIVGNGNSAMFSGNARRLDWNGNEYLAGDLYVKCDYDSSDGKKVATEEIVMGIFNHATQYTPSNDPMFFYGEWYHEVGTSYIARLNDSHAPADPELVSVWQVMSDAPYHIPSSADYNWLVYTFADAMKYINDFQNNIADIFYSGIVYEEGHYVTRDGVTYKRKSWGSTTPVAKAWSDSDWEKVEVANDLNEKIDSECSDLKSAIGYAEDKVSFIDFLKSPVILAQESQTGNYNTTTGVYNSRTDRRSTPKMPVRKYTRVGTNACSNSFLFWKDNGDFTSVDRGTIASDGFYYADVPSGYTVFAWNVNNTGAEEPNLKLKYVSPIVDAVNKATSDLSKLTDISIEGYAEDSVSASGTIYTNKMMSSNGIWTDVVGWYCLELDVTDGDIFIVTGTGNPALVVQDSNGNKVDVYAPGVNVDVVGYKYTVPENGTKMYINRSGAIPVAKLIDPYQFVKADGIGEYVGGTEYNVGNGAFMYTVLLDGSDNGAFKYKSLLLNGSAFKPVGDDIAPVSTNANYIGGNHGYLWEYVCTSTAHGLTESDIGKTYNDGTNTWVLLRVNSADSFSLGCYDSSKWWRLKNATVPATVNFGSSVSISASSLKQFYPSIRNKNVSVVENSANAFAVLESYDIWNIGTGVDAIIANAGNNTNESLINLSDKAFTIRNIYVFDKSGNVVQYVDFTAFNASIKMNHFAGSQSTAFGTGGYIAVLDSSADILQNSILSFSKSDTWDSENKAPFVFFQASADKGKGFVIVYLDDRTSNLFDSAGYVATSTGKLYPYMIQKNAGYEGHTKNIILRMPVVKNNSGADYVSFVDVGEKTYMFIGLLTAKTITVDVPFNVIGKTVNVLSNNGIVCNTQTVYTGLDISSSGEAYALIEFS